MPTRVLIAGVSTRAAAESAALAGFSTTAIDAFRDLDQHAGVVALTLPGPYSADAAAEASRAIECDAVVYLSGFENHPAAVARLAAGRELWGNSPEVLERVRDPEQVFQAFTEGAHPVPAIWRRPNEPAPPGTWLVKPIGAGGGHGVMRWSGIGSIPPGTYLQEFVPGESASIAFVAASGRVFPLGITRQIIGDPEFGARGFQYVGSVWSKLPSKLAGAALHLAETAAKRFGLVGVNGIDFVVSGDVPYPVEINPRWCASMELMELFVRASGGSVFAVHAEACTSGRLFSNNPSEGPPGAIGKACVFARNDVTIVDTSMGSRANGEVRDIPRPGSRIPAGRPVCTVFATAGNEASCYAALVERAQRIYALLDTWPGGMTAVRRAW